MYLNNYHQSLCIRFLNTELYHLSDLMAFLSRHLVKFISWLIGYNEKVQPLNERSFVFSARFRDDENSYDILITSSWNEFENHVVTASKKLTAGNLT